MSYQEIRSSAMNELKRMFRPEFLNRVDEIVVFESLTKNQVIEILEIMLAEIKLRLLEMNISLEVKKRAKEHLVEEGYDIKFGARPLRRVIQRELEDPLSVEILKGKLPSGSEVSVTVRKGRIAFQIKKPETKEAPAGIAT